MNNFIRRLPLQIILIVPFVMIVLASGGLTGFLALRNDQKSVNELADQLYSAVTVRIQQHLYSYLQTPHLVNQLNLDGIRLEEFKIGNASSLENHFRTQLRRFDTAMSIAYADEQANYVGVERIGAVGLAAGEDQFLAISGKETKNILQEWRIDEQGRNVQDTWTSPARYDPRARPWYQAGVRAGGPTWTPIFMWSNGTVGLDAVTPVYDTRHSVAEKSLLGILDTSLTLDGIGDFLQSLDISQHGQTFIMERSGLLVASSTVRQPYTRTGNDMNRLAAFDSTEPVVRATSEYLQQHFGDLSAIRGSQRLEFALHGDQQSVEVTPYHDQYGLDWLIVVVIPQADFMGKVWANSYNTELLIAIFLLISINVAILITRWVTQPILQLNQAAKALAAGRWMQGDIVGRTDEVEELASSFNRMAAQLRASFASLQRSEERYRSLFDGVPIGLYRSQPNGHILAANMALIQMLGYPDRESYLQTNAADHYVLPSKRGELSALLAQNDTVLDFEAQLRRMDGKIIWARNDCRLVRDQHGLPFYYEGSVEDITERKRAETIQAETAMENARLYQEISRHAIELERRVQQRTAELNQAKDRVEAILNNSSDVIVLAAKDGTIQQINPLGSQLLGYATEEIIGHPLTDLASPSSAPTLIEAQDTVVVTKQPARIEIMTTGKYGAVFDADVSISPIFTHDGETLDLVFSLRDITARKHLENELRQMLHRAIELGELKSRFVSMLSHEFRTQLAVIQSTNDLLARYATKLPLERQQAEFERISRTIQNIVVLVDDVLSFSEAESGSLVVTAEPLDLPAFCQDLLADLQRAVGERPPLEFSSTGECGNRNIDPKLLRYILSNLMSNAIKYSPSNVPVKLDLFCQADQVSFHVTDQGMGIPEDDQAHLFEAFHRASNVGTIPGTGLGLAIVKQSVDLHGGQITFQSKPGLGTTFVVTIPDDPERQGPG
ncbi:MAG TPA: PAS domain S-box protein [Aggregatilineales bacterium]|nr:PAS domain S-box protein [Aggregatilineales bacterium]